MTEAADVDVKHEPQSGKAKIIGILIWLIVIGLGALFAYLGKGVFDPIFYDAFGIEIPAMFTVFILSYGINILMFFPAFIWQTERFYDITGSITYLACTWYSFFVGHKTTLRDTVFGPYSIRSFIASVLVSIWAVRLGSFLLTRILNDGKDDRFDAIKPNFVRYLITWTLQGLWVMLTAYPVFIINCQGISSPLDYKLVLTILGLALWVSGFGIEVLADRQKRVWRKNPNNRGKFIEYGLWYYSRHPNYFGEVTLWTGMFLFCASDFFKTQWAAVISPIFVFCLIYFVSGVRLLEAKADAKWGGQPDYENYKKTTSVFVILPKLGVRQKFDGEALEQLQAV